VRGLALAACVLAVIGSAQVAAAQGGGAALPLRDSVSQYGITWTFDKSVPVGQFVNGDYYVVGPVRIVAIDPKPLLGKEVPEDELGPREMGWREADHKYVRNGSMLNPPARREVAYDSGIRSWFRPDKVDVPPIVMKPGDSLVSTISLKKGEKVKKMLRATHPYGWREKDDDSPVKLAAVLTCMDKPQPADAFRPSYCDTANRVYLARNLRRALLPSLPMPSERIVLDSGPATLDFMVRVFQRPWVNTGFFGFEQPMENMPHYGSTVGRAVGIGALLLCCDIPADVKQKLLINYVQVGIDYWGVVRGGHPGWHAFGGHGSGRKLPMVIAGYLLGDEEMMAPTKAFPELQFQEDMQTIYDTCWTGAKTVYAGHLGSKDGKRVVEGPVAYLSYEHLPPSEWKSMTGEGYRRCCTSIAWVGQALALHVLHLEDAWNHPAFFDYVDRWMNEDDTEHIRIIKEARGRDYSAGYARQGQAWDAYVNEMWAAYRNDLP